MSINIRKIHSRHRFLLTGTPIQNSLDEMWSLFDYVSDGTLLGSSRTFKLSYANPIVAGSDKNATEEEKKLGHKLAENLREMIAPYFLRREKAIVLLGAGGRGKVLERKENAITMEDNEEDGDGGFHENKVDREITNAKDAGGRHLSEKPSFIPNNALEKPPSVTGPYPAVPSGPLSAAAPPPCRLILPPKNDFIVWTFLSPAQQTIYDQFLNSSLVAALLNSTASVLAALTVLKKLCDHPYLLLRSVRYREALGFGSDDPEGSMKMKKKKVKRGKNNEKFASTALEEEKDGQIVEGIKRKGKITENGKGSHFTADVDYKDGDGDVNDDSDEEAVQDREEDFEEEQRDAYEQAEADVRNVLCNARGLDDTPIEELIAQSGKLEFLQHLLDNLRTEGHRVLLFSQSLKMLDIIARMLKSKEMTYVRIDGTISKASERQRLIDQFNTDSSIFCFMLTTQVNGWR